MDQLSYNAKERKKCKTSRSITEKRQKDNERKRKERQKLKENPEEYEKVRIKEKERYQKRKKDGKLKSIAEKTKRQQRQQRKDWRINTRTFRERNNLITEESLRQGSISCSYSLDNLITSSIKKRNAGRKTVLRNKSVVCRKVKILESALVAAKKKAAKYKKRYERLQETKSCLTPRKEVKFIMSKGTIAVKRELLFGRTLIAQLVHNSKLRKSNKEKFAFTKVVTGKILKKYKVAKLTRAFTFTSKKSNNLKFDYKRKPRSLAPHISKALLSFFEDDENSSLVPGKNDCISKCKTRKQKRYLNDTLKNLHKKFIATNIFNISYSTFCRAKPFWVVKPQISARDTCMCKKHANFQFLITKLHILKIIKCNQASNIISTVVCDSMEKKCMYHECLQCTEKTIAILDKGNANQESFYYKWVTKKEKRLDNKGKELTVHITTKDKIVCPVYKILAEAQAQLPDYLKHCYNASHQYRATKELRKNLKPDEISLIIDFSENYECKYNKEIQSAHFGASKNQITVHTAVLYYKEKQQMNVMQSDVKCLSFATISKCLRHDACAVGAHLCIVLDEIHKLLPEVKIIHFQSDGPTTQYKNKTNFFLFAHFANALGFQKATWNFSEAGHGKGPADAIGGVVKRYADQAVAHGADIVNADQFLDILNEANIKVKILQVKETDIVKVDNVVPDCLKAIKNTMLLHQLVWQKNNHDQFRLHILSCFDCGVEPCPHFIAEPYLWITGQANEQIAVPVVVGQWVAVIYDDQWFPGIVDSKRNNLLTVNFMTRSKRNFCWPVKKDLQKIPQEEILCIIKDPPKPITRRYFSLSKEEHNSIDKLAADLLID